MPLNEQLAQATSPAEALDCIVKSFGADSGTIHFLEQDGLLHLAAATAGMPEAVLNVVRKIPIGKGMAGLAAERKEPVTTCNIQTDQTGDVRAGARATALAGALVVPIFDGAEVVGTLGIANRAERAFSDAETSELLRAARLLVQR